MVVEGRAVHFGREAAASLGVPAAVRDLLPGGSDPEGYREHLLRLTYEEGARFVADLVRDGEPDPRPARLLGRAFPDADVETLSELQLRARYSDLDGASAARTLLAGFRGGAKALVGGSNASVLAFADEASAKRYLERSKKDVPAERRGTLVLRAAGGTAKSVLARMVQAATR